MKSHPHFMQLVIEKLQNRPKELSFRKIEQDTGLNRSWLWLLSKGKIDDPGYKKLMRLHTYLN